jgi:hypothetical protein
MIEDYFHSLLEKLFISPAVSSFKTVKQRVQEEDGYLRSEFVSSPLTYF